MLEMSSEMLGGSVNQDQISTEMLNVLPFPLLLIDQKDRFVWLNPAAESFFKSSTAFLAGHAVAELIPSDSPFFALLERVRQAGRSVIERELGLISPKLGVRKGTFQMVPVPARNKINNSAQVLVSIQEQSMAEQLSTQNQFKGAALSMSKMTALLAHEIKNPLAGIKGAAQLLELDLPAEYRELSGMIVDEADRITSLLSRIETLSTDAPLKFADVNIHEVLDHCIKITKASFGRHLQIVRRYDPSLPDVRADRELLVQCFLNLFKNAAEATKVGDELVLGTSYSMTRYISSLPDGKRVHLPLQIEIEDTGTGIPEELSEHIFEPFISTKSGGSGLGLAMVASVIADHGGTITHQRRQQVTCFSINLPFLNVKDSDRVSQSCSSETDSSSLGEVS
tara:strand:- start:95 stop:1282 length:1188 start_codon:yes stop_codon:yes gene_type:complete